MPGVVQGLKPAYSSCLIGPTEVVPLLQDMSWPRLKPAFFADIFAGVHAPDASGPAWVAGRRWGGPGLKPVFCLLLFRGLKATAPSGKAECG